ncbi:MAG: sigma-54-dependent Fis family transcriptional regulator [Zetaproteobacteria bacterium]|nr:MAG: sigma-54-dependent Fis family transcriptional regulator [Zetaproteobacteria bacterium]
MAEILLVDDDANARMVMALNLQRHGHRVTRCAGVRSACAALAERHYDVVITDLRMEAADSGLEVVRTAAAVEGCRVLLLTAYASADTAVQAMRLGAFDYLTKPVSIDDLAAAVERALEDGRASAPEGTEEASAQMPEGLLLGESLPMQRVRERLLRAARRDFTVLISGESGTGKECSARFLHAASPRRDGPFVPVHCAAIPEGLFEAELFGYCRGAFTGAERDRQGLVEAASGGTLFLDEVGEIPPSVQVKLLRMLQERTVRRVGEQVERPVDVRVVAATNRDLAAEVERGAFREDLFYRLNVVPVHLPPLRARREDLPLLIRAILARIGGGEEIVVPAEVIDRIAALPLPGNVRELENLLQRLVALSDDGRLDPALLDEQLCAAPPEAAPAPPAALDGLRASGLTLDGWLERIERGLLAEALAECGGNATRAAELLGISFRSMRYRLRKLGLKESS